MSRIRFGVVSSMAAIVLVLSALASSPKAAKPVDASTYFAPHVTAGQILSDITYRVIALHGPGFDDRVAQIPATGTFAFEPSDDPAILKWKVSVRMDGKTVMDDVEGEYRDNERSQCFKGQCSLMTDASSPFFNPSFWGQPKGTLSAGMIWTVDLKQPWELGPAGTQTITVLSVDPVNGIIILKREGEGDGPYEGKHQLTTIKKDGKAFSVTTKYGRAHWLGQAIFQHGITISDELLTITPVDLSSPELGTIRAEERQYMSLLEHPGSIPTSTIIQQPKSESHN